MIPTLISDITDQEPGVITKRDNTRSLLLRPVDLVAFAKENPSYQGPGNSKNWLLPRLRPVRVHHANQYPAVDLKEPTPTKASFGSRPSRKSIPSTTSLLSQYPQQLQQHPITPTPSAAFLADLLCRKSRQQYALNARVSPSFLRPLQAVNTTTYTMIYASHYVN